MLLQCWYRLGCEALAAAQRPHHEQGPHLVARVGALLSFYDERMTDDDRLPPTGARSAMTKPGAIEWWHCLDVWTSLGGHPAKFDEWIAEPRRTRADAWAQLMAAIKGDVPVLLKDSNPPAGALLEIVESRWEVPRWLNRSPPNSSTSSTSKHPEPPPGFVTETLTEIAPLDMDRGTALQCAVQLHCEGLGDIELGAVLDTAAALHAWLVADKVDVGDFDRPAGGA